MSQFFRNILVLFVVGIMAAGAYVYAVTRDLPSVTQVLRDGINPTQWTQVFASDGTPILSFGKFKHDNTKLTDISPHFIDALLATEDRRFYSHGGVDPIAIMRAVASDLTHKKFREGGSTLTQQLARNVFLSNERTMSRKIREAALAMQLERRLTKDQILELYVNNIYFGEGAYGVKAASEIYFGKPPSKLTLAEAALLAGLPQAPSGYNPFQNQKGATERRNEVLQNLMEVGKITATEFEAQKQKPVRLNPNGREMSAADRAPFFNRYVMDQVMRYYNLDEQSFWQSGLKIYTTLDFNAQMTAARAVANGSNAYGRTSKNQQAALLSLNPKTGAILAYVGGKNYQQSQFDRVTQATRSPGSLFKVFTYTTAIDRGYEPTRVYLDEPVKIGDWQPENYDKAHHGYMTIARALVTSNNIVAVKVINELGADAVIQMAQQMGITTNMQPYLGLTLGGSDVKLFDITSAFGVLANQGVRVEPYAIDKIVDDTGHEIFRERPMRTNVLNRKTVDTMVKMMQAVIVRGTGRAANIGRPAAGKTGTSDDYRDAWFVGFTPDVVTGVWVGNDNNSPMPGMTGGALPAVIWRNYMKGALAGHPARDFDLSQSKPLQDEDFERYDLKNLSDQESPAAEGALGDGEIQIDPLLDPLAGEDDQTGNPGASDYPGEFGNGNAGPDYSQPPPYNRNSGNAQPPLPQQGAPYSYPQSSGRSSYPAQPVQPPVAQPTPVYGPPSARYTVPQPSHPRRIEPSDAVPPPQSNPPIPTGNR